MASSTTALWGWIHTLAFDNSAENHKSVDHSSNLEECSQNWDMNMMALNTFGSASAFGVVFALVDTFEVASAFGAVTGLVAAAVFVSALVESFVFVSAWVKNTVGNDDCVSGEQNMPAANMLAFVLLACSQVDMPLPI